MAKEVHNVEEFLEAVEESDEGEHIVFVDESSPAENDADKQKAMKEARKLARKKDVATSFVGGGYNPQEIEASEKELDSLENRIENLENAVDKLLDVLDVDEEERF